MRRLDVEKTKPITCTTNAVHRNTYTYLCGNQSVFQFSFNNWFLAICQLHFFNPFQRAPCLQLLFNTSLYLRRLMATSPSAAQPSSSMEESQPPHQPISTQQDGEADHAVVTSQPVSSEQQAPPPTTVAPDAKPTEEGMDHLTVISDNMETSKYNTCPVPVPVTDPSWTPSNTNFLSSSSFFIFSSKSDDRQAAVRVNWTSCWKLNLNK